MGLLIEVIGWLFMELIFYGVFYAIGWVVLMAVTFGNYPGRWRGPDNLTDAELVALVGLIATVIVVVIVVK
ncbi:hypothetical protein [Cupriavidus pauculus]|uniref:Uncharacterized protein n=1 Tax=Cupriavidus pauculus TaxID=82633 RepID=A0A2N5C4J7_9BURK|nr:hypothetical protein [Cupriavidus pauculus]PLP97138.1 hypothetical protein CYJ10_29115 [Cupriavidus pauculus]